MGAPGPDDARYWERLKKGPPLDEWVEWPPSPAWLAEQRAKERGEERQLRVVYWVIGLVVAGFFAWQIIGSDAPTPPDCASVPETPCLNAAGLVVIPGVDGALMTLSLDEWREAKAEAEAPNGVCQDDRGAYPC